ncbi:MAG: RNA-binding protein 5 [Bathelium mastoideum]|nr:MAG: RNA-binding protein 5 [Bathelium mastoideum]
MSSYRDSFRPSAPRARRESDRGYDRYRSRSPPQRRRTPPQGMLHTTSLAAVCDRACQLQMSDFYRGPPRESTNVEHRDNRREWGDRRDYDLPRGHNHRYDTRSVFSYDERDYRDRDRAGHRSPRYSSRSRSRSWSPRRRSRSRSPDKGRPSRELKLDGFPTHMTENDIRGELEAYYNIAYLDDVRIIRDRKTGRVYAFVTFPNVDVSRMFMDQNFPSIRLGVSKDGRGVEPARVGIAYSRQEKDRGAERDTEWMCADCQLVNYGHIKCRRCQAPGPFTPTANQFKPQKRAEMGDKDASPDSTPSQYLLVRQLEPSASEEVLAKGVEKLYKGTNASGSTEKPKAKVISTTSTTNLGAPEGSLLRVLLIRDKQTNESWRYGFAEFKRVEDAKAAMAKFKALDTVTVSSKPIQLAFAHSGVFMPAFSEDAQFTFMATANASQSLQYWCDDAYASELKVAPVARDSPGQSAEANPTTTNQSEAALTGQEKEPKSKKRKAEGEAASAKKKSVPSHLQFWQDRRAELHGTVPEKSKRSSDDRPNEPSSDILPQPSADAPPSQRYGDPNKKCCYLCRRKFVTISELNKHERLSAMHAHILKGTRTRLTALALVRKFVPQLAPMPSQTPAYRDRAAERRQTYNQPKRAPIKMGFKKKAAANAPRSPSPQEPEKAISKGASLLGKMGYVEGQGLGAAGEGRIAPIETEMYREGVGLGAEGGRMGDAAKEAGRNTRSNYDEFLERTREKAQERYNSMKETGG